MPRYGGDVRVTAGTTKAGAVLVPDSTKTVDVLNITSSTLAHTHDGVETFTAPIVYDHNTTITAFATGGQASATALTGEFNNVTTCATAFDSVKLLTAVAGQKQTVKNSGAATLSVFPFSGDSIDALAVNLSVDVPVGATMTFRCISATVWETQEVFYSSAPTTQKGGMLFKAADNSGNTIVTLSNASHGQATTVTIPDGGAATSYVVQSTAALTLSEADYLDITTLGTGAASKAIVLDGTGNYTFPASHTFKRTPVALTATTPITALLHSERTLYVTGTAAAAYTLPEATGTGDRYTFFMGQVNTNGTTFVAADTTNCSFHGTANLLDVDSNAQTAYFTATAGGDDTVTFNGTTTGGRIGDMVTFVDLATDVWHVHIEASVPAGSNVATPFSSAA